MHKEKFMIYRRDAKKVLVLAGKTAPKVINICAVYPRNLVEFATICIFAASNYK